MIKILTILMFIPVLFSSCRNEKLNSENLRLKALLEYSQKNFSQAKESIDLYMKRDSVENESFNIAARIYFACGKNEEALGFYDKFCETGDDFTSTDLRNYMFLLYEQGRIKDCRIQLEKYFETASYFYGLGQFASEVYEKDGAYFESVLCAWLDLEYLEAYQSESSLDKFLSGIKSICTGCRDFEKLKQMRFAVSAIESMTDETTTSNAEIESDFFIYKYIKSKEILKGKTNHKKALETYIGLENYFCSFPKYYFFLAKYSADNKVLDKDAIQVIYEKIIKMKPESEYTKKSKIALAELWGIGGKNENY